MLRVRRDRIERSKPRFSRRSRRRGILHGAFTEGSNAGAGDFVAASLGRGVNRLGPAPRHSAVATRRLDQKSLGMKLSAMTDKSTTLIPQEGWHCLHLYYQTEYGQWQLLSRDEQNAEKKNLSSLVKEVRAMKSTHFLTLRMVRPKPNAVSMLMPPDL